MIIMVMHIHVFKNSKENDKYTRMLISNIVTSY